MRSRPSCISPWHASYVDRIYRDGENVHKPHIKTAWQALSACAGGRIEKRPPV